MFESRLLSVFDALPAEPYRETWVNRAWISISGFYLPPGHSLSFQATPGVDRLHVLLRGRCRLAVSGTQLAAEAGRALGVGAPGAHQVEAGETGVAFITLALRSLVGGHQDQPGLAVLELMGPLREHARARMREWAKRPYIGERISVLPLELFPAQDTQLFELSPRLLLVLEGSALLELPREVVELEALSMYEVPADTPHRLDAASLGPCTLLAISELEPASHRFHHLSCGARAQSCDLVALAGDGLVQLDERGHVLHASPMARRWLGVGESFHGALASLLQTRDREWLEQQLTRPPFGEATRTAWSAPRMAGLTLGVLFVPYQGEDQLHASLLYLRPAVERVESASFEVLDEGVSEALPLSEPLLEPAREPARESVREPARESVREPARERLSPPHSLEVLRPPPLVCLSPVMTRLERLLPELALLKETFLLVGEPGTGRSHLARQLHSMGAESLGSLRVLSCANLGEPALRGALWTRPNPQADTHLEPGPWLQGLEQGSLLIEEAYLLTASAQVELLRALARLRRQGLQVRVMVELEKLPGRNLPPMLTLEQPSDREGLRLIELPPLRERLEEVPVLLNALASRHATQGQVNFRLTSEALEVLLSHPFPMNVKELERLARVLTQTPSDGGVSAEVVRRLLGPSRRPAWRKDETALPTLYEAERQLVTEAMQRAGGNKAEAARLLDIPRPRLYRLLAEHQLE
ncbi:MAG: helix-turn-helix domain-containing protein [Myxococcota bacterium]